MTNSIWDTRFNSGRRGAALDAEEGDQQWITIKGARVLVDGDGNVVGGAEGKFNGSNYKEERAKAQEKKTDNTKNANSPSNGNKLTREEMKHKIWLTDTIYEGLHRDNIDNYSDKELQRHINTLSASLEKYKKDYEEYGDSKKIIDYPLIMLMYNDRITELKQAQAAREYKYSQKDVKDISNSSLQKEYKQNLEKMKDKSDQWMYRAINNRNGNILDELHARYKDGRIETYF